MAIITEGYYGDTKFDCYDSYQVFRIHGYTSQPRVVAVDSSEARKQSHKYLTIPVDTPVKFRVVKGHQTVLGVQDLETILEENQLPVLIQAACDKKYRVKVWGKHGSEWKMVGDFGNLLITKHFEECFMMMQCLYTQDLNISGYVNLLALTPEITMTAITGFAKGTGTDNDFQAYLKKLVEITEEEMKKYKHDKNEHSYDMKRGNPDWAFCFLETESLATGSGGETSDYAPLVPFEEVFPDTGPPPALPPRKGQVRAEGQGQSKTEYHSSVVGLETAEGTEAIYEEIDPDYILDDAETTAKVKPDSLKQKKTKSKAETKRSQKKKGKEFAHLEESIKRRLEEQKCTEAPYKIATKVNVQSDAKNPETTNDMEAKTAKLNYAEDTRKSKTTNVSDDESRYVPLKRSAQESGYLKVIHDGSKVAQSHDSNMYADPKARESKAKSEITAKGLTKLDVAKMTIAELGESLMALKLDKHVKTFKEQLIDGAIVQDLTVDDFVKEFKLTKLESLRLAKFVATGHIPK